MDPNWRTLACLLVAGSAMVATCAPSVSAAADRDRREDPSPVTDGRSQALRRLRADAPARILVHDGSRGGVDLFRGAEGATMVRPTGERASGPRQAAGEYLRRYGALVGIAGTGSEAVISDAIPSASGGTVVRARQEIGGLPVFGGEVVVSLNAAQGLTSLASATAPEVPVPPARVPSAAAQETALAVTAKAHAVKPATLRAQSFGRWLYDPALTHTFDPFGPRPVWRFEVSNGVDIRELVLVDSTRGAIALHYNQVAGLNRIVCDSANSNTTTGYPACTAPVRTETSGPTGQREVDSAFDNTGATAGFYQQVAGLDISELIGTGPLGSRQLASVVRWCFYGDTCPMPNAYWDGSQMVYGDGYASADDVVAHELTHGVIDHTSQLFYLHQSGAINESLADVIGEIVDHRHNPTGGEDNTAWLVGEDVPGGALRSLKDPTLFGQPDTMTSPLYAAGSIDEDSGEVHTNDGVGNRAAYLISQGGTVGGVTIAGIDGTDSRLTKTATLYSEVIKRLTSGSEYADLARVLITTCDELAAAGRARFNSTDCVSVRGAVTATEMTQPPVDPAAAAAEAPETCPAGTFKKTLFRDDDDTNNSWDVGQLWIHAPDTDQGVPGYAATGTSSWFGFDPNPLRWGDPYSSSLSPTTAVTVPAGQPTFLHFRHAHVFEWYDATTTDSPRYPDGGRLAVLTLQDNGDSTTSWSDSTTPLQWVNGPSQPITNTSSPWMGFGGDSRGYGSSRVELTPLAGQQVRPQWSVAGDYMSDYLGWWIDDIEIYTCPPAAPSAPRNLAARGTIGGATLTWAPPSYTGSGITGYRITRSDGTTRRVSATARQTTFTSLPTGESLTFTITALNADRAAGAKASTTVHPTALSITPSTTRTPEGKGFTITSRLARGGTTSGLAQKTVILERRAPGARSWSRVSKGPTRSDGTIRRTLTQGRTYDYRTTFPGAPRWIGTRSPTVRVQLR